MRTPLPVSAKARRSRAARSTRSMSRPGAGFVADEQLRLLDEGAHQQHATRHPARELVRIDVAMRPRWSAGTGDRGETTRRKGGEERGGGEEEDEHQARTGRRWRRRRRHGVAGGEFRCTCPPRRPAEDESREPPTSGPKSPSRASASTLFPAPLAPTTASSSPRETLSDRSRSTQPSASAASPTRRAASPRYAAYRPSTQSRGSIDAEALSSAPLIFSPPQAARGHAATLPRVRTRARRRAGRARETPQATRIPRKDNPWPPKG